MDGSSVIGIVGNTVGTVEPEGGDVFVGIPEGNVDNEGDSDDRLGMFDGIIDKDGKKDGTLESDVGDKVAMDFVGTGVVGTGVAMGWRVFFFFSMFLPFPFPFPFPTISFVFFVPFPFPIPFE